MTSKICFLIALLGLALPSEAPVQTASDLAVLKGLAKVTVLLKTPAGQAALHANYTVTGGIQTGKLQQATLLPFAEQQLQALRDAFITDGNLAQLADGLGTTLGAAYIARAHYLDRSHWTLSSQAVSRVITYANLTSGTHSNAGKYLFANATIDGTLAASPQAAALVTMPGGVTDIFGRSYGPLSGKPGADRFGNSRPFQTEPSLAAFTGLDYFNQATSNGAYLRGPLSDLTNSPAYPSGHTSYGYMGSLVLAMLVPDRYQQMVARGAEYGNDRILLGAHYAMDVLGGRTLAMHDMAHLLANDPAYMGRSFYSGSPVMGKFREDLEAARSQLTTTLQAACGKAVEQCAREDIGRFSQAAANEAFYTDTQTYNLPVVYPANATGVEDVSKLAPEAGYLLIVAFPALTMKQANEILTETEGPGGGFLDDGSSFGIYSRLNLYAAAGKAAALAASQGTSVKAASTVPSTRTAKSKTKF